MQITEYKASAEPFFVESVNGLINAKVAGGKIIKQPELVLADRSFLIFYSLDLYNKMLEDGTIYSKKHNEFNIEEFIDVMIQDDVDPNEYVYRNNKIIEAELYNIGEAWKDERKDYFILRLYY